MSSKTPLYEKHLEHGAKMVDFAGYLMPLQYTSVRDEHLHVRSKVGVFDVSHMGEFLVYGSDAVAFVDRMTVNNVAKLQVNQVQYSAMCYPHGGIVDDLLVYRFPDHLLLVVNAANLEKDWNWLQEHLSGDVRLENASQKTALLAVQGPQAPEVVQKLTTENLDEVKYYWFREGRVEDFPVVFSRTGYTGEPGFELYVDNARAPRLWDLLLEAGAEADIRPVGLGARDSLRLEMKYCLYGNDIDETTTPLEAGLGWITKTRKAADYLGKARHREQREKGVERKLVAFELLEKGIPRHGYPLLADGRPVGKTTSGIFSPSLEKGIGLGYVPTSLAGVGQEIEVEIRGRRIPARIVEPPFYRRPEQS
jgi:aminomethyltransferase